MESDSASFRVRCDQAHAHRVTKMDMHQQTDENIIDLRPLAGLVGPWEGDSGKDLSRGCPTPENRCGRWTFKPIGHSQNYDQNLYGLSCSTKEDPDLAWHHRASTAIDLARVIAT